MREIGEAMAGRMGNETGNQGGKQTPETDLNRALRDKAVFELRMSGLDFDEIAIRTGYENRSGAYKAWKRVLDRIPVANAPHLRELANQRLDVALFAIWPQVKKGSLFAIDRMLAIEERRSKLLGLDLQKDSHEAGLVLMREYAPGVLEAV